MQTKLMEYCENFNGKKCLSIITNEVIWGMIIIFCGSLSLIIVWASYRPVDWVKYHDPYHEKNVAVIVAGIFALAAIVMSIVQIVQHFLHKSHHPSQKRIIRIIAIIPIYAVTSWLSLLYFQSAIYMEFLQSCYEAYVIYCFLLLLTKYLGGHRGVEEVIVVRDYIKLPCPCCCIKPTPSIRWVWYFKIGLLQYTWINPLCSAIAIILNLTGLYGNGEWKFNRGYPYIIIIVNISQTIALYSLVAFYANAKNALKPFRPLSKFICIKLIVFFIFWQGVLMSGLAMIGTLRNTTCDSEKNPYCNGSTIGFTVEEEKILLENVLICVEMFFFAIAYDWVFGWKQYADGRFKQVMELRFREMNNNQEDNEPDAFITWL